MVRMDGCVEGDLLRVLFEGRWGGAVRRWMILCVLVDTVRFIHSFIHSCLTYGTFYWRVYASFLIFYSQSEYLICSLLYFSWRNCLYWCSMIISHTTTLYCRLKQQCQSRFPCFFSIPTTLVNPSIFNYSEVIHSCLIYIVFYWNGERTKQVLNSVKPWYWLISTRLAGRIYSFLYLRAIDDVDFLFGHQSRLWDFLLMCWQVLDLTVPMNYTIILVSIKFVVLCRLLFYPWLV